MNDTIQARYTILRGNKNIKDVGKLVAINDLPLLKTYKDDECNFVRGTDKVLFSPFQKKYEPIWAYSHESCRPCVLRFSHKKFIKGIKTKFKELQLEDDSVSYEVFKLLF